MSAEFTDGIETDEVVSRTIGSNEWWDHFRVIYRKGSGSKFARLDAVPSLNVRSALCSPLATSFSGKEIENTFS